MTELNKEYTASKEKTITRGTFGNQIWKYYFKEKNKAEEWDNIKDSIIIRMLNRDAKQGKTLLNALALDRETETPLGIVTAVDYNNEEHRITIWLREVRDEDLKGLKR